LNENELLEIINRKNLKKVIMTENYSASLNTCKKYFLENINIEQYNDKKRKEIIKIFEEFYIYISNNKSIFENDISSIIEYFKNNDYILYLNNDSKDTIILKYYKGMKKQKEIVVDSKRYTYQEYSLKKIVDLKKIKTSIKANYIHAMDASLIR
jgi:DNA-directed RNA polymerase